MEHYENCERDRVLKRVGKDFRLGDVTVQEAVWLLREGVLCFCSRRLAAHRNSRAYIQNSGDEDRLVQRAASLLLRKRQQEKYGSRQAGKSQSGEMRVIDDSTTMGRVIEVDFRNRRRLD